jgi:hypothetical protein
MRMLQNAVLALLLVLGTIPRALAQSQATALPYPTAATPSAVDLGEVAASDATPIFITLALHMANVNSAESLMTALYTPGSPKLSSVFNFG